jgi:hypothetical protein
MLFGKFMNKILEGIKAISGAIGFNYLPKEQRQVTFYSEGKNYWPHIQGLMKTTLEKTDISVCYVSSSLDDPGIMMKHPNLKTFFIGMASVRDYFFQNVKTDMMVMTMPDLHKYQIKRSHHNVHYIYVQHSLSSLHSIYRHGAFDHYDTVCAAGPHHVEEIRAIEAKYDLPKKNIIELGYSRLDNLIETIKKNPNSNNIKKQTHKKILVAPSWGPEGIIESGLGKNLIDQLLDLGHEVILRPHPRTIKFAKEKVTEIKNQHKDNPHLTFEENVSKQESFLQSDIMVSDWSGAAFEFALALNKPVIFCEVPRKINNTNYKDIEIEPFELSVREEIGVIWDGKSPIEEMVELCSQKRRGDLDILIDKYCFNQGYSDKIFVKILSELLIKYEI